jgi:hypothetical protein
MAAMEEALTNAGILLHILSYEGPGSWLFVSPVSKLWKQCYEQLDPAYVREGYPHATMQSSLFGEAFQSPSRLRWACEHTLQALFASEPVQISAGTFCDAPTLLAAQELGFHVTDARD